MTTNVIAVLNGLIETSKDGERGFMKTAEDANHASVKDALLESADRCTRCARELQDLVLKLGGKPEGGGSVAGALHRGWLDVKSAVGSRADHAILADCEKGEGAAKKRFHEALEKTCQQTCAQWSSGYITACCKTMTAFARCAISTQR